MHPRKTCAALAVVAAAGGSLLGPALVAPAVASAASAPTVANLSYSITAAQVAAIPGEVSPGNTPAALGLYYPEGVAAAAGSVYIANTNDNTIGELSGSTPASSIFAGTYEGYGRSGDGGPATAATLYSPGGVAVDGSGDVFIADTEDNVVREVYGPASADAGQIATIAGTGTAGDSGDGGPATAAELDSPQSVAVDGAGDVYIADTYNDVVREVSPAGTISTVAGVAGHAGYSGDGGPATSASLDDPSGVAVDALGNLYIADSSNNVIRRVQGPSTAGTGQAAGQISTVAGSYTADEANDGQGGHSGDGGPATSAQLFAPEGVALDDAGDLFIADTFNNAIREVSPAGIITTLVNTSAASGTPSNGAAAAGAKLEGPYDVAVDDSTGDVYVADTHANGITEVTGLTPTAGQSVAGPGSLASPGGALPEAPLAVGLPLAFAAMVAGGVALLRRRRPHPA